MNPRLQTATANGGRSSPSTKSARRAARERGTEGVRPPFTVRLTQIFTAHEYTLVADAVKDA